MPPSSFHFTPSFLRSLTLKLFSPSLSCSSASKHSSYSKVLPSTPLSQVLPSTSHSQVLLNTFSNFQVFSYQAHFLRGTSLFELYCILPRERTRGEIWLLNPVGRAPVPDYTKVANRRRRSTLRAVLLYASTIEPDKSSYLNCSLFGLFWAKSNSLIFLF